MDIENKQSSEFCLFEFSVDDLTEEKGGLLIKKGKNYSIAPLERWDRENPDKKRVAWILGTTGLGFERKCIVIIEYESLNIK